MKDVTVISWTTPAKPRSKNYSVGSTIINNGNGGTTIVKDGNRSSVDIIKEDESKSFTDSNVLSALRSVAEFISRNNDSSVKAIIDYLNGIKIKGIPLTRILEKSTNVEEVLDSDLMTALRVLAEIADNNVELKKIFLRKDNPDTAQEIITFLKGLLIGNNGSSITVLDNGMSQAVIDYLYVKVKAVFDALDIKKKTYVGGEQVLSPAGMKCIRVDELDNVYRCHFKLEEDGIEIENRFTPGSLAIAQECNIKTGISHHVGSRYYWREVTAVGADYIDLSKTVCDPNVENDVPAAGDDIVALGHRTNITRQGAIVLSSVNEVAPSVLMYQGIDDFSLVGKEVIAFDYDKATGKAGMRVYGDAYIGARDRSSYIEYIEDGLEVKAKKILLGTGSTLDDTLAEINDSLENVSHQLDESFQIWQGETADAPTLTNPPASGWATDDVRSEHVEDFYITTEGLCYQFVFEEGSFRWRPVTDKYLIAYVQQIGEKKRVFTSRPTDAAAYDAGDCWVNASYTDADGNKLYDNDRLVCVTAKAAGAPFSILHWRKDSKYTDDSKAEDLNKETVEKLLSTGIDIENNSIIATADKFMIQGRDGKKYAVFEVDSATGRPMMKADYVELTSLLVEKAIKSGGLNINDKFVVEKDGSGRIANGALSWDKTGTLYRKSREIIAWRYIFEEMEAAGVTGVYDIDLTGGTFLHTVDYNNAFINLPAPSDYPEITLDIRYDIPRTRTPIYYMTIKCDASPILKRNRDTKEYEQVTVGEPDGEKCTIYSTMVEGKYRWIASDDLITVSKIS